MPAEIHTEMAGAPVDGPGLLFLWCRDLGGGGREPEVDGTEEIWVQPAPPGRIRPRTRGYFTGAWA